MAMSKANSFKLVLLGESAVGKSSLVLRFVRDEFSDYRESTIGAAFLTQSLTLEDGTAIKFEIWDTAGQERYRSLAPIYFRNSAAAVIVYDVTQNPDASFEKAKTWVQTLKRQADPGITIILVANKIDLCADAPERRRVSREDAERYAADEGLLYAEASAKTGEGVQEIFVQVAKKLPVRSADALDAGADAAGGKRGLKLGGNTAGARDACNC